MSRNIPLFKIYWDEDDLERVQETIKRGMYWAIGPNIEKFEEMIAAYVGTRYAVTFNSGTSALHAVLLAYGITASDEIIVPSFTFISTANAPLFVGAKPVFADIEERTLGLDPKDVIRRINSNTKAIIPIHYGGCPCLIGELREIARQYKLLLIEDAAESLGASVDGKKVGSFGDCAILSFCANKVITTGEGGAVVTDSAEIYKKLKLIRSHGRVGDTGYFSSAESMDYVALGYNFRMSDITAALGIAQLGKIDKIISMRREKAERLSQKLQSIPGIDIPAPPEGFYHIYQMYTIILKEMPEKRGALQQYLAQKGIMSKVYFSPVHLTNFYQGTLGYRIKLPVTEKLAAGVLTLPMYPRLTDEEIDYIAGQVAAFFRQA